MLPETPDVLMAAGTLLAGAAAMWGAYSACWALGTWRRQLVMQVDQDPALRIIKELCEYRAALLLIKHCYPLHSDDEKVWEGKTSVDHDIRIHRWRRAMLIEDRLRYACHEAEMFWPGEGILPKLAKATDFSGEIFRKLNIFNRLGEILVSGADEKWVAVEDEYKGLQTYLDSLKDIEDQFFSDLRDASADLEAALVSKVRGQKGRRLAT